MSALCEALIALNMTLGVVCQDGNSGPPSLPPDDPTVWEARPPAPDPEPVAPAFPPVIIKEAPPPPPPAPPPRRVAAPPPPPPPDPYRLALERAQGAGGGGSPGLSADGLPGWSNPGKPPGFSPLAPPPAVSQARYDAQSQTSGLPVDNTRILAADRYISGIVETGLNSQIDSANGGGTVIIQTSRDVFGYHGRYILIPKGSRLICEVKGPDKQGNTRVGFLCTRILMAGHRAEILQLAAPVGDVQGRAGVTGEVDNRFWEKYGTAFVLAGLSASIRLATAMSSQTTDGTTSTGAMADQGSQELSAKLGDITASILEQTVNLKTIVTLSQGQRVQIRPAQDWYIRQIGETP